MGKHRPYIALFLAGIFAFNMLGFCLFSMLILTHKKSTFHKIIQGEFKQEVLIAIRASDLHHARWEHEKEFEWNGEMYDIVEKETSSGELIYLCKKDTKEDRLKKLKRKSAEKSTAKKMADWVKIFVQSKSNSTPQFKIDSSQTRIVYKQSNYLFGYSNLVNPPPKS